MFNFNRSRKENSPVGNETENNADVTIDMEALQEQQRELTNKATRYTMELMEKYDVDGPGNVSKYDGYAIAEEARELAKQDVASVSAGDGQSDQEAAA